MSTKSVWKIVDAWGLPFDCLVLRDRVLSGERPLSTRRQLLLRTLGTGAALVGGSALAACARQSEAAGLGPPETTTVRIVNPVQCDPGLTLARSYLIDEGFTDVQFVNKAFTSREWITDRLADFALRALGVRRRGHRCRVAAGRADGVALRLPRALGERRY